MDIIEGLKQLLPEDRIRTRLIDRVSYASDAGFYHLLPLAVVRPVDEKEIGLLFSFSQRTRTPMVFRAGGSSLSGQSITDGILVDLSQYWNRITTMEEGLMVRVQPGITGAMVNAYLRKFHRKIGPDPSSISAAMMGGILSNNASGMCCGVQFNSYHTTRFIRFVLTDGQRFTTEVPEDYERFVSACGELARELTSIRQEILGDRELYDRIRKKYTTKNTVGYSLNAFVDFEHPLDIFAHLLIGAEGTLAFISEAVLDTIPDLPCKATSLLYFPDIYAACKAILPLKEAGAAMVELMDRASLRSVEDLPGMDPFVRTLPDGAAALLIEFQELTERELEARINDFLATAGGLSLLNAPVFALGPKEREALWKMRKGLFPAVGAVRASGTTVILEDIAFPVETLGDAVLALQGLFRKYAYDNAIIFGHAKDGNIHFVVTQSFNTPVEVERYDRFLREVVELVVNGYKGTLKAEHGTGRNMAPFVETEWGGDAYRIMKRIKKAADPMMLLNPDVIISEDKDLHIRDLKQLPVVEEEVDKCIECGYCEHKCPSRDLTMTPRRRIVARRALVKMKAAGEDKNYGTLLKEYQYDGLETCAVDGLCAGACPVDINTGDLVKRLRRENHSRLAGGIAFWVARHFSWVVAGVRMALEAGNLVNSVLGKKAMGRLTRGIRKIVPACPLWTDQIGRPPDLRALAGRSIAEAGRPMIGAGGLADEDKRSTIVYFPACISRVLANAGEGKRTVMEAFLNISAKAGIAVRIIEDRKGSCCGQIFGSKGFADAYRFTANKIIDTLWESTAGGSYPVVLDISSCTYTLHHLRPVLSASNQERFDKLTILDSIDYLHDMIMPLCPVPRKAKDVLLHTVCSVEKMGIEYKFKKIAEHFAARVTVPVHGGCCGMAGDRGFLFPELTHSATLTEAAETRDSHYDGCYSSTVTCEMAMSAAVNKNYQSILFLVDEAVG